MQGKLVFIHSKQNQNDTSVISKSIQLSLRKKSTYQSKNNTILTQNQNGIINANPRIKNVVRKFRKSVASSINNQQTTNSNRRLLEDIQNILSIQNLIDQRQNFNIYQPAQANAVANINTLYPIFVPNYIDVDYNQRYDQDQSNYLNQKNDKNVTNNIRKFSVSQNCFYGSAQPKFDLNKKGKIIRGIQSAKRNKSTQKAQNAHMNDKYFNQQKLLQNNQNKIHIFPRSQQGRRRKSHSVVCSLYNQPLKQERTKQNSYLTSIQDKEKICSKFIFNNQQISVKKISASRALQYFSQVFKRQDIQRIKIKKGPVGQSQNICAKRLILKQRTDNKDQNKQNKCKRVLSSFKKDKQNIQIEDGYGKSLRWKSAKSKKLQKINFSNDENFDLKGWQVQQIF